MHDEEKLWLQEVQAIKKLKTKKTFAAAKKNKPVKSLIPAQEEASFILRFHGVNRPLEKFKEGKIPAQATVDLHGLTQDKAHAELTNFITTCYQQEKRALLVITGKSGVLNREVPRWLGLDPLESIVLATKKAKPKDGGAGALYVLLKKLKL